MEDDSRSMIAGAIGFFVGVMVGVSVGLLTAPQSGERTRRKIQNRALDVQEDAEHFVKDAKNTVSDWVDRGKKSVVNS